LNLFFKLSLLFLTFVTAASPAQAIIINGIYTGSCERKLGIIVGADTYSLQFLNLSGELETLPRHQVVQMLSYSVDAAPFQFSQSVKVNSEKATAYQISTVSNMQEKALLTGLPIDFTDSKLAFLTEQGTEVLIDKRSISKIQALRDFKITGGNPGLQRKIRFGHSYAFVACEKNSTAPSETLIYPDQILTESLTIKRELDRLQKGFELVHQFEDEQDFYSKPLIYTTGTQLGLWYTLGSRYGVSTSRTNNFTPVLHSEVSNDIYDFQRVIITGSAPNAVFEHEEPQTQLFYAFKSSYFHMLAYLDPSLFLVGTNYPWKTEDIATGDAKYSSTGGFGFGFDRGAWQLGFVTSRVSLGVNPGDFFWQDTISVGKIHLTYGDLFQNFEFFSGQGVQPDFGDLFAAAQLNHLRLNYNRQLSQRWKISGSYISNVATITPKANRSIAVESKTLSGQLAFAINRRLSLESLLSVEKVSSSYFDKTTPKIGTSLHILF
jgi:hypothetical protein